MQRQPISILGAGIAGLTLGHCLRHKGIQSIIYDRASSAPRHSYGITLEPQAYKPLLNILKIDEGDFRKQLAVDNGKQNGVGRVSASDGPTSTPFRANRSKLETMLREGQTIRTEHLLSSASMLDDRELIGLQFKDGPTIQVPQVVDATGVHSPLRKSLLPMIELEVQPFAVYSGKRYVKADTFEANYTQAFGDDNLLVRIPRHGGQSRLEISVNEHKPDGTVSISYIYSRPARDGGEKVDPLHRPDRANAGATDIPGELYEELNAFLNSQNVGTPFAECFNVDQIRNDRVLHWLMRTAMVPKRDLIHLLHNGIVMIGDSVHAVPILGGHGANTAILDAIKLANAIAAQDADIRKLESFYQDVWKEWDLAVERSKKELAEMHRSQSTATQTSSL